MEVIETENLGKKYIISHQAINEYQTLRETITNNAKNLVTSRSKVLPKKEEFWALRNVTFDVEKGDRIGIIGRNGAGKSTLLKLLSRITEPSEGKVKIRGKIASLLEVGTGFHPELTGRENIYLNGAVLGMSRKDIKKNFDEIVAFAEVEKFLDTPVKRYSSGMYVRLAFSVAAHLEPDILLIDEVLAVGDAQFQKKSLGKMEEVSKNKGRTILFVSHNMGSVSKICDRCIQINSGKIVEDGPAKNVIYNYLNNEELSRGFINWGEKDSAPGDKEYIYCNSLKIFNMKGEIVNTVFSEEQFFIEIGYTVLKTLNVSQIGIKINLSNGETLLQSGDFDLDLTSENIRKPGKYLNRCLIPEYLLNEGVYSISIFGHIPGVKMLINEENLFNFEVILKKQIAGYGRQPGIIRSKLQWNIDYLG
ncbi:MAG: ABC transporter ATP-binding protein [Candidatus Humimicrobiaceae bacterium]